MRVVIVPGSARAIEDVPADVVLEAGHTERITAMAFSPDRRFLASASEDHNVLLWDPKSGSEVARFGGHAAPVRCIAFSPGGRLLVSGADDGVKVWDVEKQSPVRTLSASAEPVFHVAISNDARHLITAGGSVHGDGFPSIRLWDVESGRQVAMLAERAHGVTAVFFTMKGQAAVARAEGDIELRGTLTLFDVPSGRNLGTTEALVRAVTSDGRWIALQSGQWENATIGVQDGDTGRKVAEFAAGSAPVVFSPDGEWVANIGYPNASVTVRRTLTGEVTGVIRDENWAFERVAVSADGSMVATAGRAPGIIQLWNTSDGKAFRSLDRRPASAFAWTRDSKGVITAGYEIQRWDIATKKATGGPAVDGPGVGVALSPDENLLAVGGRILQLANLRIGAMLSRLSGPCDVLPLPAFSPDGSLLAASCRGIVTMWLVPSGVEVQRLGGPDLGDSGVLSFSPDGRFMVASAGPGRMRVYRRKPPGGSFDLKLTGVAAAVAFAPEGRRVALGTRSRIRLETQGDRGAQLAPVADQRAEIAVFDLETGRPLFSVPSGDWVSALAFSEEGRTLMAASGLWQQVGRVVALDASNGSILRTIVEKVDAQDWAAFSPDRAWLAASSSSPRGAIKLWRLQ